MKKVFSLLLFINFGLLASAQPWNSKITNPNPTFFDILIKTIKGSNPKTHYGGFSVNITKPTLSDYYKIHPELPTNLVLQITKYCSGRFYYLSKDAVIYLLTKIIQTFLWTIE